MSLTGLHPAVLLLFGLRHLSSLLPATASNYLCDAVNRVPLSCVRVQHFTKVQLPRWRWSSLSIRAGYRRFIRSTRPSRRRNNGFRPRCHHLALVFITVQLRTCLRHCGHRDRRARFVSRRPAMAAHVISGAAGVNSSGRALVLTADQTDTVVRPYPCSPAGRSGRFGRKRPWPLLLLTAPRCWHHFNTPVISPPNSPPAHGGCAQPSKFGGAGKVFICHHQPSTTTTRRPCGRLRVVR